MNTPVFKELNVVNLVCDYGAVPGQDCTSAFQQAVDDALTAYNNNGTITKIKLLGSSQNYYISKPILCDVPYLSIEGDGRDMTIISGSAYYQGTLLIFGVSRSPQGFTIPSGAWVSTTGVLDSSASGYYGLRQFGNTWIAFRGSPWDIGPISRNGQVLSRLWGSWKTLTVDFCVQTNQSGGWQSTQYGWYASDAFGLLYDGSLNGGTIRFTFTTSDGVYREAHIAFPTTSPTLLRCSIQLDLANGLIYAWINRTQVAVDLSQIGSGWQAGLNLANGGSMCAVIGATANVTSGATNLQTQAFPPQDLTWFGFKISSIFLYNVPPAAPTLTQASGGSLAAATEYYKLTFVNSVGETTPSTEASIARNANELTTVTSPVNPGGSYTGYNVYAATTSGGETLQNSSPIAFGTNWTEPTTGLTTTGKAPPPASTAQTRQDGQTLTDYLQFIYFDSNEPGNNQNLSSNTICNLALNDSGNVYRRVPYNCLYGVGYGLWMTEHDGATGYNSFNNVVENIQLQGKTGQTYAYGQAIAYGNVIRMIVRDFITLYGSNGIGDLGFGASYPITVKDAVFNYPADTAITNFYATVYCDNIVINYPNNGGIRDIQSSGAYKNVFLTPPGSAPIAFAYLLNAGFGPVESSLYNWMVDNEGVPGSPAWAYIWAQAGPNTWLNVYNFSPGTLPSGSDVIRLLKYPYGIYKGVQSYLHVENILSTRASPGRSVISIDGPSWVGKLTGTYPLDIPTIYNSGSGPTNIVIEPVAGEPLSAPAAPTLSQSSTGGTVAAGTYGVIVSLVNNFGEVASTATTITTSGSTSTITINSPANPNYPSNVNATSWYAYVTQAGGNTYTRQQAAGSPTAIGTNFTLNAPPTSTGANPPTLNTTNAALPATATTGLLAIPTVAQDPTGTPDDAIGKIQACFNVTNGKLWFYTPGGWKSLTPS